jgi:cardiolipin synthase A/B
MNDPSFKESEFETMAPLRSLAEQIFSRTAGAPLERGNYIRILKDAQENYPAWIEAISTAKRYIHFETYIIHDDETGALFADLLVQKAEEGIKVRVLYDWLGSFGKTSRRFWKRLRAAGIEVRCFNPPQLGSPFGWLTRDHRKMISVDGEIGFVTGLCIGRRWVGDPKLAMDPWRDTGVVIKGPAVADVEFAFSQTWEKAGGTLPGEEFKEPEDIAHAGEVALRVVATEPNTAGVYRFDQLIASLARKSLWLADAYFIGSTSYIQALRLAAMDGVDVRLLIPGSTDIPILRAISRSAYYPLLEAGVRVYEWNGSMMHAKTAVADGRWARVGSTNLNPASWIGNYELDVVVEDGGFATAMEEMYQEDLRGATEIVLSRHSVRPVQKRPRRARLHKKMGTGSVGRAGVGAIRLGSSVGAAFTNHRVLGPAEAKIMILASLLLSVLSVISLIWPKVISIPLSLIGIWLAISLAIRAYKLYLKHIRDWDRPESED